MFFCIKLLLLPPHRSGLGQFWFFPKILIDIRQKACSAVYDTPWNSDSAVYHTLQNGDLVVYLTLQNGNSVVYDTPRNGDFAVHLTPPNGNSAVYHTPQNLWQKIVLLYLVLLEHFLKQFEIRKIYCHSSSAVYHTLRNGNSVTPTV